LLFTDAGIGEVYASRNEKELIAWEDFINVSCHKNSRSYNL
jgi:hypothetical protein